MLFSGGGAAVRLRWVRGYSAHGMAGVYPQTALRNTAGASIGGAASGPRGERPGDRTWRRSWFGFDDAQVPRYCSGDAGGVQDSETVTQRRPCASRRAMSGRFTLLLTDVVMRGQAGSRAGAQLSLQRSEIESAVHDGLHARQRTAAVSDAASGGEATSRSFFKPFTGQSASPRKCGRCSPRSDLSV